MHRSGPTLLLSATDLSNFLGCRHHTGLDLAVADGLRAQPWFHSPLLEVLKQRGKEHEAGYVASLRESGLAVCDLSTIENHDDRAIATREAMRSGADAIIQGTLQDENWRGLPDVMRRVDRPSALGAWSYEIADTKLARETRAGTILQLGLYSELLAAAQGSPAERFHVVTPETIGPRANGARAGYHVHTYRVDDYAAYFRLISRRMMDAVALGADRIAQEHYPDPVEACQVCRWSTLCAQRRHDDDHLSLVAGLSAIQRRELESRSITTLATLAALPLPLPFKPARGSLATYVRAREQARLQHGSRGLTRPLHELLDVEPGRGLCRLPEPTPADLFLDLEGDPLAVDGGREYLFGLAAADGTYRSAWSFNARQERRGFEWVIDTIEEAAQQCPAMHVYHYAPYEPAAFKRLMGRYASREGELDAMLRSGRFIDLFAVTRQALRAGVERYSIKNLEPLYDFHRVIHLHDANRARSYVEQALEMGAPDAVSAQMRDTVEQYNRDDCLSALRLRDWLESQRSTLVAAGADVPRPSRADGTPPAAVDERARHVEALRARLLDGLPEERAERSGAQQASWLLAYMLDYHRRETKAKWWEFFRLCDLDEDELLDDRAAVAGLEFVDRIETCLNRKTQKPTGSVIDRYRYPPQELEIARGNELRVHDSEHGATFGTATAVDRLSRTIDIKKPRARADEHPHALFSFTNIPTTVIEDALTRIAERVLTADDGFDAARALLAAGDPRLTNGSLLPRDGESAAARAVRVVRALDRSVLAVQGPPGSGKTYCGARMILELVRQGKRVGITATSHNVIRKLLDETHKAASATGVSVRLAHKTSHDDLGEDAAGDAVRLLGDNEDAHAALGAGEVDVLGATAWFWSRAEAASSIDVLFVDEAGQMALPNVVAASQAAGSIVLLGDPRQLEQPRQGSHPDGVDLSALEHILGDRQTIPDDRGIFLPESWRLSPAICRFTSDQFYENRLTSCAGLEAQRLVGVGGFPPAGLALVSVEHRGNRSGSDEEVEAVAAIVARLTASGAQWVGADGAAQNLCGSDVLVIAPYNVQVNRLADCLTGTGVRVGTVDRFQGQEAAIAIYSMTASSPADAPRGMEFLFSLNRLNVATSRARCLAIIVASPRLFEAECRTPRQMMLANGLCRFRELATEVPVE